MQGGSDARAGAAIYSPLVLGVYDLWVLAISNTLIWKCPSARLLAHYDRHVRSVHLDVGVGTGYFLDRTSFPSSRPEITLFDLNPNSLQYAARRVARYQPTTIVGDVLEPAELPRAHFESVGLNFVFHCLPDGGPGKWRALDQLKPLLAPGGTLFGSTILGAPPAALARQRWLMATYNRKGIFSNAGDSLEVLRAALDQRFDRVEFEVVGVVALFAAS